MKDYQREKINHLLEVASNDRNKWSERHDKDGSDRAYHRYLETIGYLNGMREALLALGYSVGYTNDEAGIMKVYDKVE